MIQVIAPKPSPSPNYTFFTIHSTLPLQPFFLPCVINAKIPGSKWQHIPIKG